jgi:XTP/dITP diphosphohydrolase
VRARARLYLASSNLGKLAEFRALAEKVAPGVELELLPGVHSLPRFEETLSTFAENAAGKALHYSGLQEGLVFADDSGLVVPALGGAPGVLSARYAGVRASDSQRIEKLLRELGGAKGLDRRAQFVCVIALAAQGRAKAVVSDRVHGEILEKPRGDRGFGYDPVFYFPPMQRTFAELSPEEKNEHSHRGRAFRKLLAAMEPVL